MRPARTFRGSGIMYSTKWHHPEYLKLYRQLRPIHCSQHSNRAFRPCKTRLSSQICGKFYQIITINLNQLQTVFLPKQQQTQVAEAVTTPASCGMNCLFNLWLTNYERCIYLLLTLWKKFDPHVLTFAPLRVVWKPCDHLTTTAGSFHAWNNT